MCVCDRAPIPNKQRIDGAPPLSSLAPAQVCGSYTRKDNPSSRSIQKQFMRIRSKIKQSELQKRHYTFTAFSGKSNVKLMISGRKSAPSSVFAPRNKLREKRYRPRCSATFRLDAFFANWVSPNMRISISVHWERRSWPSFCANHTP